MGAVGAWNPWRTLSLLDHVTLELRELVGVDAMLLPGPLIVLDRGLDRRERNAALAHELVHLERGGGVRLAGMPAAWRPVAAREEQVVDRTVARRLVPPRSLRWFLHRRAALGVGVTVDDVVEEFDVPEWVARQALGIVTRAA